MRIPPDRPLPPSSHAKPADAFPAAAALARDLARAVRGEVRFDRGARALYASDASNYRQIPIGVVVPRDDDDVRAAVAVCRVHGAPVLPRGAGTSLAGQSCNVAVVLDFTKFMHGLLELDPARRLARVQPGLVLDTLRRAAGAHGLTFGPDPSTHNRCTLGGMIGNNSCGTHSLMAGKTVDNVESLRVLLYDGTELTVAATDDAERAAIVRAGGRRGALYAGLAALRDRCAVLVRARYPDIPRRVSGYNLDELLPERGFHVARALVGSEGTCAIVLEATVRLIPDPAHRALVGLGYPDVYAAADAVPELLEHAPIALEGFEGALIDGLRRKGVAHLDLMPEGRGVLLVELAGATAVEADASAARLVERLARRPGAPDVRRYTSGQARLVWKIRESGPRAAASAPGLAPRYEGWDDAAVAPTKLGAYLRELRALLDAYRYQAAYYGHFGHGCVHMQVSFDLRSDPGIRRFAEFLDAAADLVVSHGGSISGEHGDGQARGALLPKMFGPELVAAFREFKALWDPDGGMNPRKLVDAFPPTENLRLGADYAPRPMPVRLALVDDEGSLERASLRCIGVGECRKQDAGTMCPSYMATLDEAHSTRGRARLLFEMLQGEVLNDGWRDEHVKRALDLCLSCKACKVECPANVDLATYKAEFLAHYYDERRRPVEARLFAHVDRWLRLVSRAPGLANALARAPAVAPLVLRLTGLAPARPLPRVARRPFQASHAAERARTARASAAAGEARGPTGLDVVLWPDTFHNYLHPGALDAAAAVLERAGYAVHVPAAPLCCGRPLYDFGLLDEAGRALDRVLEALAPHVDAGRFVVVLEPSCASMFRDELRQLRSRDPTAERLARQAVLLSEFLHGHVPAYAPPRLDRPVLLHGHCHQRVLTRLEAERALLDATGARVEAPDAGCCGLAGPFGYGARRYAVSMAIGERVLLPAVRAAAPDTLVIADGFSCREQIRHGTGRRALHLAEALALAQCGGVPQEGPA